MNPNSPDSRRVAFATLGCKLNLFETTALGAAFREREYELVPFEASADYYVINSCTVTSRSDSKSRQLVRRIRRREPEARIIVTGCYAERAPEELSTLDGVYLVAGNRAKFAIPELLDAPSLPRIARPSEGEDFSFPSVPVDDFGEYTRAFLKVQDGCNFSCAFCAIKAARGVSRSLPMREVLDQAQRLAERGYRELTLTGVDPGAWGRDLSDRPTLAQLVHRLTKIEELERIRLSSVGVQDYDDPLIELITQHPKMARHVHLPVQSGDDSVLRAMRRGSRRAQLDRLVDRLVAGCADLRFGGDFMVGFPGETRAAFDTTRRLLQEGPWSYAHVFPFSPRPGTRAVEMGDQVPLAERNLRGSILRELMQGKDLDYRASRVGRVEEVLVESRRESGTHWASGLTSHYVRVVFPLEAERAGQFVPVCVTRIDGERTEGLAA